MEKSRTQQALALMRANPGLSARQAAKTIGLSETVLSRALKVQRENAAKRALLESGGYVVSN
jgi:hypothetical protein